MKFKRKIIVGIVSILLLSIVLVTIYIIFKNKNEYIDNLISVLSEHEETTVQDIFSFKFERAYVFNDCYISGDGFANRYNLDISINEVKSGVSENVQRIVFVNKSGSFVYEFKCDNSKVFFLEKGIVIYPETVIKIKSSIKEKPLMISFQSSERYDS